MKGKGISSGIGIGRAFIYREPEISVSRTTIVDGQGEMDRFDQAVKDFAARAQAKMKGATAEQSAVMEAHVTFAEDPSIRDRVKQIVEEEKINVEAAVADAFDEYVAMFESFEDEMWRERAADLKDVRSALLRALLGIEVPDLSTLPDQTVLVAHELTPSVTAGLHGDRLAGFVIETGGVTSHTAILARSLEIPAVVLPGALDSISNGDTVVLDGDEGNVETNPAPDVIAESENKRKIQRARNAELKKLIGQPSQTLDGVEVNVFANMGQTSDTLRALENDAEGVGLFRTEFLYMDHGSLPSEEQQFEAYKQVVAAFAGKPVIFRTMDVGGDKDIPYLNMEKEENPFLGFRAIRHSLVYQDIFKAQIKALLRASAFGAAQIMLPMITGVQEVLAAKTIIHDCMAELKESGIDFDENIPVGIMIETPAAAVIADQLAVHVDFFSVGTNDLIQYTIAVDRGNDRVESLYTPYHPAVLRLIKMAADAAAAASINIGMCGEAAGEDTLIPIWVALGLTKLSVSAPRILATRARIRACQTNKLGPIAEEALSLATAEEVRSYLQTQFPSNDV